MTLNFEPVSLEMQDKYLEHLAETPQKTSDYCFANLWGWAGVYGLHWAWSDGLVWIKQTIPEERFWAPVGPWGAVDWNRCVSSYFSGQTVFIRVPEDLLDIWKGDIDQRIFVEETRGDWDYLYSITDLVELRGKRFHKKKNLLNQFKKKYDFRYISFGPEIIDMAREMQEDWCTWRDCESFEALAAENRAISRVLNDWDQLDGLKGGAIMVDQEMAAYTIVESLSRDMLVIHFEKGNANYKGVYQAINQMFLEYSGNEFNIVNREQDLDDEGLRKAKLSYQPTGFLKKYRVILK